MNPVMTADSSGATPPEAVIAPMTVVGVDADTRDLPAPSEAPLQPTTTALKATSAHVRPILPDGVRHCPSARSMGTTRFTTSDTPKQPKLFGEAE